MKDVLIPTDFSANSWNALKYAIRLFEHEVCNFYILHIGDLRESVINSNSFTFPTEKIGPSIKEKLKLLFKKIDALQTTEKHHFIALQEYGNFIDVMRKTIEVKKVDLIVMGTTGASGIKATVVGSNTGDVITKVLCNVLVIPENAAAKIPERIAFPTDYNLFYTYPILEALTEILRISKAKLHVLNVSKSQSPLTVPQEVNKAYLQDYLGETFPKTHSFHSISNKNISAAILDFAANKQIEMLTMVAKNLNFFQKLLFDTSIEKLSFHTTVPLLVLHE
ncbi:universal stress protein [Maribacter chungangensis]|uniref:Universal stress protein n=1 Tax=Maribacter chungangensis TaxID=1069117 RepID=A0ABW3B302_9FLAO